MRIIGGIKGGLKIPNATKLKIRPTKDVTKEALFNILNSRIAYEDLTALDLFAGSGAISYELASRGAKKTVAVEQNSTCFSFIKKTISTLGLEDRISAIRGDVWEVLATLDQKFQLIFADPPYSFQRYEHLIRVIMDRQLLAPNGLLVIEHNDYTRLEQAPGFKFKRKYGKSACTFLMASEI